ncbi:muscarinic acetylcholine receptor M4-like [Lytechinus pictus]|uniref:muscarinic acetylcholine receptor M4-like n=1 Tax=Lytechinus pictus TaxID=7653 RepID=UPI00240D5201|nr:muscarinic acetylcholine receptor M4-like [Lytechinus pictus]
MEGEGKIATNTTMSMMTTSDGPQQLYTQAGIVLIYLVVSIIITLTVTGNILVILAYCRDPRIRDKVANLLILNLAITDLIVGVFSLIFNFSRFVRGFWPYGEVLCKLWTILDFTVCWMSIITIVLISWDRYTLVRLGIQYKTYQTKHRVGSILIICWIFVVIYWTLIAFTWGPFRKMDAVNYGVTCRMEFNYTRLAPLYINLLPFSALLSIAIAMNVSVYVNIYRRSKGRQISPPYRNKNTPSHSVDQDTNESSCRYTPSEGSACLEHVQEVRPENNPTPTRKIPRSHPEKGLPDYSEIARTVKKEKMALARHRKAAIVLSILTGTFMAFWLPYKIMTVFFSICGSECVSDVTWEVTEVLAWCNSTINPLIYAAFNVHFRKNFRYFLQLDRCKGDKRKWFVRCERCVEN